MHKMQFGSQRPVMVGRGTKPAKAGSARRVAAEGPENGTFARYDSDVRFTNITPTVNVCRVKDDDSQVGVAKGMLMGGVPVVVPKNDAGATAHAMKKRCDHKPVLPEKERFDLGHRIIMGKVPVMPTIVITREDFEAYVSTYTPEKAARLLAAVNAPQLNYEGERSMVFAKQEVLLKDHGAQPRVIYQQTDMHNALAGVICVELNRRMKSIFSKANPLNTGNVMLYACGLHNEEIGDILEGAPGVVIENDMRNNDGSQSAHFRRSEAMMYAKLGAPAWFVREFARNTEVKVWTRFGITSTVKGQMWSGRNNTTTGNSYVGMAVMSACLEEAGIKQSVNIHGGDDYLGIVPDGQQDGFKAAIEKVVPLVGMEPEVVIPRTRQHATFYRKRYVRSMGRTRGVPMFGRVLSKINLRANQNAKVGDREYMAGKYLSAAYEHRYVPVIGGLLRSVSEMMSPRPYIDADTNRKTGGLSAEKISEVVASVQPLDEEAFSGFLGEVYQVTMDELVDAYTQVANGCIDYLNKWTVVARRGRSTIKPGYVAPFLRGTVAEKLVRTDLSF